jgi:hypothetical protein
MFLYATLYRFTPRKRFRRDFCLIVAALGHYPRHKHLARGGRFVDRGLERSGQGTTGPRQDGAGVVFSNFRFFSGNAKI